MASWIKPEIKYLIEFYWHPEPNPNKYLKSIFHQIKSNIKINRVKFILSELNIKIKPVKKSLRCHLNSGAISRKIGLKYLFGFSPGSIYRDLKTLIFYSRSYPCLLGEFIRSHYKNLKINSTRVHTKHLISSKADNCSVVSKAMFSKLKLFLRYILDKLEKSFTKLFFFIFNKINRTTYWIPKFYRILEKQNTSWSRRRWAT